MNLAIATAHVQVDRVAQVRGLFPDQIQPLIGQYTDRQFLGIFSEPGVNVLKLNLALDRLEQLTPAQKAIGLEIVLCKETIWSGQMLREMFTDATIAR